MAMETVAAEEVEVSMAEVVEGALDHIKMELIYHMPPVTLKIQSGTHSQTIQGKGSLRNRYAQSSWKIKRGAPPDLSLITNDNENRLISKIITGVQNATRNESVLAGVVTRLLTNISRAQVFAENRGSNYSNRNETEERSVVIYMTT